MEIREAGLEMVEARYMARGLHQGLVVTLRRATPPLVKARDMSASTQI
jgi:hypothetical protein